MIGLSKKADGIELTYYTDPLCCWSWAMEPHWERFLRETGDGVKVRVKMGGLLPSWSTFHDTTNAIHKPIQMGPEWLHAKHVSGVDLDDRLWIVDPPESSFPACIAVKSAELQSPLYGAQYLRLARQAAMLRLKNIARTDVLLELAKEVAKTDPVFNVGLFRRDLQSRGVEAFKEDWREGKYRGINRFPTLVFKGQNTSLLLSGYQRYESLTAAYEACWTGEKKADG